MLRITARRRVSAHVGTNVQISKKPSDIESVVRLREQSSQQLPLELNSRALNTVSTAAQRCGIKIYSR